MSIDHTSYRKVLLTADGALKCPECGEVGAIVHRVETSVTYTIQTAALLEDGEASFTFADNPEVSDDEYDERMLCRECGETFDASELASEADAAIETCRQCGGDLEPGQIGLCETCAACEYCDAIQISTGRRHCPIHAERGKAEPQVSWMVEWSSGTARGNCRYSTPESWPRAKVIAQWESLNAKCNVEVLRRRPD